MTAEEFWRAVAARLERGVAVFVTLVVDNTRGSPGTLGAHLLVDANGDKQGTIGGGIMEVRHIEQARERLQQRADGPPELHWLAHRKDTGRGRKAAYEPSGLICAGEQTNLSLVLQPERDGDAIRRFCDAVEHQSSHAAVLRVDEHGVAVEAADEAGTQPGMALTTGEGTWCYRESSVNRLRLAVVGGGHCGKALAPLALQLGYWVDVYDTRPEQMADELWSEQVRRHVLDGYDDLHTELHYPQLTTVVVMTAAVHYDIAALASVVSMDLRWLGVMGSVAKIHEIHTQLQERDVAQDAIDTIHGPIGLRMKSDTPAEIAVSIMGQLLAERRGS